MVSSEERGVSNTRSVGRAGRTGEFGGKEPDSECAEDGWVEAGGTSAIGITLVPFVVIEVV